MLTGVQQHSFSLGKVAASADLPAQNSGIGMHPARQLEEWAEHLRQELQKLPEAPEVVPLLPANRPSFNALCGQAGWIGNPPPAFAAAVCAR